MGSAMLEAGRLHMICPGHPNSLPFLITCAIPGLPAGFPVVRLDGIILYNSSRGPYAAQASLVFDDRIQRPAAGIYEPDELGAELGPQAKKLGVLAWPGVVSGQRI